MRAFKRILPACLVLISVYTHAQVQEGRYIDLPSQDVKLYYEESGSGAPLIFIPGWTMTTGFFSKQKEHFSKSHRFLSFDPRSHGNSEKTLSGNTYEVHAQDLAEFLALLNLKEVVLVGWSSGCITMFEYIRLFGAERVKQFVFIDETPKWIGDADKEWVYGNFEDYKSSLKGLLNTRREDAFGIVDWMLKDPADSLEKAWMVDEMMKTPDHAALSLYIDSLIGDYTTVLQQIKSTPASAFLLREAWYDRAREWLSREVPQVTTASITSHAMFWEDAGKFNRLLQNILLNDQ